MKASEIIDKYISFFEERGHKRIANSPLVPQNDPTTLFTLQCRHAEIARSILAWRKASFRNSFS